MEPLTGAPLQGGDRPGGGRPGRRSRGGRRGARTLAAIAGLAAAAAAIGCGPGPSTGPPPLPGPGGRIDPTYDLSITFPGATVDVDGLPYQGIDLDTVLTFDDASVRDADPRFTAPLRVVTVAAGGVRQTFSVPSPIVVQGSIEGSLWQTDLFGAVDFGSAHLVLSLTGAIQDDGRRLVGSAIIYGSNEPGTFVAVRRRRFLVAATDLVSSIGQTYLVEARYDRDPTVSGPVAQVSSDPVARMRDGRPFVVNRFSFDNLQGLEPAAGFDTAFQYSTGTLSNPHDLAVLSDGEAGVAPGTGAPGSAGVAFVTRYEPPFNDLALFDLDDGGFLDSIDLAPYARNPDHLPRADQVLWHDGLLWVTLEDADTSFTEFETGRLAIIDPVARRVTQVIDLAGQNPFESLAFEPTTGLIWIGLAGLFPGLNRPQPVLSGGIEAIDPATRVSRGLVVDDDALGGNVSGVAIASTTRGYAVVTDASFHNFVKAFDPSTGAVLGTVFDTTDRIASIVADGDGWVVLADQSFVDPRLIVLDAATGLPVASLPIGLPPQSIAVLTRGL